MIRTTFIVFEEVEYEVEFDWTPSEPAETGPNALYPGCDEEIEIQKMVNQETEEPYAFASDEEKEIEELVWEKI